MQPCYLCLYTYVCLRVDEMLDLYIRTLCSIFDDTIKAPRHVKLCAEAI